MKRLGINVCVLFLVLSLIQLTPVWGESLGSTTLVGGDEYVCRTPFASIQPPVQLLSFTVFVLEGRKVKILWKTGSEMGNDYFTLERSSNAKTWEPLFQLKGAGNSQRMIRYEGNDSKAYLGKSYYRLKQTDFSGESSYSEVLELYIDPGKVMPLTVYPNPTQGLLTIEGAPDELDSFSLYDQGGNNLTPQVSVLDQSDFRISVDMSRLPRGIYLIKTENETLKVEKE